MKAIKDIYVEYELGEIPPEKLPSVVSEIIAYYDNEYMIVLSCMSNPSKIEIEPILLKAFDIPTEYKMNPYEKMELIINRLLNDKIDLQTAFDRIREIKRDTNENWHSLGHFLSNVRQEREGYWIPSDSWDGAIEEVKTEIRQKNPKNNYSEYLL